MKDNTPETQISTTVDYEPAKVSTNYAGNSEPGYTPPPIEVLPEPIRRFLEAVAAAKDIDIGMAMPPVLAVLSASIGNARVLRLREDYYAPAVLWPVLVASSGDGKSPAFDAAMKPLIDAQKREAAEHQSRQSEHAQAHREWKSKPASERRDEPAPVGPMRHVYVSDCTVEGLAVRLADNPRGLLLAVDELNGWAKSMNAYKSGGNDRESYLAFYDARAAKIDRKTSTPPTIFIPRAFVSITGTIQPKILTGMLSGEAVDCGLAARLMIAMPPTRARTWKTTGIPADIRDGYAAIIVGLRNLSHDPSADPHAIVPTDAAMTFWREWHDRHQIIRAEESHTGLRAAIPKLIDIAGRLALIVHLVSVVTNAPGINAETLDETSIRAGITLAGWYMAETRRVYMLLGIGDDTGESTSDLLSIIRRKGGSITARQLRATGRRYRPAGAAVDALDGLVRDGLVTRETIHPTGPGAPATAYRLSS